MGLSVSAWKPVEASLLHSSEGGSQYGIVFPEGSNEIIGVSCLTSLFFPPGIFLRVGLCLTGAESGAGAIADGFIYGC